MAMAMAMKFDLSTFLSASILFIFIFYYLAIHNIICYSQQGPAFVSTFTGFNCSTGLSTVCALKSLWDCCYFPYAYTSIGVQNVPATDVIQYLAGPFCTEDTLSVTAGPVLDLNCTNRNNARSSSILCRAYEIELRSSSNAGENEPVMNSSGRSCKAASTLGLNWSNGSTRGIWTLETSSPAELQRLLAHGETLQQDEELNWMQSMGATFQVLQPSAMSHAELESHHARLNASYLPNIGCPY